MKYRKLRIAWTVTWGVVAVLLCVLWVRSLSRSEWVKVGVVNGNAFHGQFMLSFIKNSTDTFTAYSTHITSPGEEIEFLNWHGFYASFLKDRFYSTMPFWSVVPLTSLIATLPWLPWLRFRFSLRTLLIATTLVAVVLGFVVWANR